MIDFAPPGERKDAANDHLKCLQQNVNCVETIAPGSRLVTNPKDIIAISEPTSDESSPDTKQILLQVVDTAEGPFGIVAAKIDEDKTALLVTRFGDDKYRATIEGLLSVGEELTIPSSEGSFDNRLIPKVLLTVNVDEHGNVVVENPTSKPTVKVYTDLRLSPNQQAQNLPVDYRKWAPLSMSVKQLIQNGSE